MPPDSSPTFHLAGRRAWEVRSRKFVHQTTVGRARAMRISTPTPQISSKWPLTILFVQTVLQMWALAMAVNKVCAVSSYSITTFDWIIQLETNHK